MRTDSCKLSCDPILAAGTLKPKIRCVIPRTDPAETSHPGQPNPSQRLVDVCVRGSGIVGCTLALMLAERGWRVILQGGTVNGVTDVRAYALNPGSVALLQSLGVWTSLRDDARTAMHDMRVQGDLRRGALNFSAWQQNVSALGWIVDANALEVALSNAVDARCALVATTLERQLDEGIDVDAALLAVAEGGSSRTRSALGVEFNRQPYGQHAVAARLTSDRSHQNTARQWFLSPDVLALLPVDQPVKDTSYALVWSVSSSRALSLMSMDSASFEQALNQAVHGDPGDAARTPEPAAADVGHFSLASPRATWPLSMAQADRITGPGWALLGDAAHVIHPLAGQGLNLGLADVLALVAVIDAKEDWRPIGDARLLSRYARRRSMAVDTMTMTTDALQWLFAHPSGVVKELRNVGMSLVEHLSPLKRRLARQALGP